MEVKIIFAFTFKDNSLNNDENLAPYLVSNFSNHTRHMLKTARNTIRPALFGPL